MKRPRFAWLRILWIAAMLYAPLPAAMAQPAIICDAASPTNPDTRPGGAGGMGGTGINAATDTTGAGGMGGTGITADIGPVVPSAGGMGGTGIVGVITGFASICVNGVEVHYDSRTPVAVNGKPGAPRDLAVGQVVAVNAREIAGRLHADGIGVIDAVAGPVTRVNAATRELQVMGQTVRTAGTAGADLTKLRVGAIARVAGHRAANGDVIATRVDAADTGPASLHGMVTRVENDAIVVNGTRVRLGGRGTRGITTGSEVFVSGDWRGNALQAQRLDAQPVRNAIARAERAVIEGYIRGKTGREINVGAISVRVDERVRYNRGNERDAVIGAKVQVEVRRSGNDWHAERVRIERDERGGRGSRGERDESTQRGEDTRERGDNSGRSSSDRAESGRSDDRSRAERPDSDRSRSDRSGRDSGSGSRRNGRH